MRVLKASKWERLSERQLLGCRISDLNLEIQDTWLQRAVRQLGRELHQAGFSSFRPEVYLGDDWYTPIDSALISVPFWLAHPRLTALEERHMGQAEGASHEWCMKLLRHEAGHCFDHGFDLSSLKTWQKIFGDPDQPYNSKRYHFDPQSLDFVLHLEEHYAQSHPQEDFAETFAVCITPGMDWRYRYGRWPGALRKLTYVQTLIERYGDRCPRPTQRSKLGQASRMRRSLGRYYEQRARGTN